MITYKIFVKNQQQLRNHYNKVEYEIQRKKVKINMWKLGPLHMGPSGKAERREQGLCFYHVISALIVKYGQAAVHS